MRLHKEAKQLFSVMQSKHWKKTRPCWAVFFSRAPGVRHVMTMKKMTQLLWNQTMLFPKHSVLETTTKLSDFLWLNGNHEVFESVLDCFVWTTKKQIHIIWNHLDRNIGDDCGNSMPESYLWFYQKRWQKQTMQCMKSWTKWFQQDLVYNSCDEPQKPMSLNVNKLQKKLESHPFGFE